MSSAKLSAPLSTPTTKPQPALPRAAGLVVSCSFLCLVVVVLLSLSLFLYLFVLCFLSSFLSLFFGGGICLLRVLFCLIFVFLPWGGEEPRAPPKKGVLGNFLVVLGRVLATFLSFCTRHVDGDTHGFQGCLLECTMSALKRGSQPQTSPTLTLAYAILTRVLGAQTCAEVTPKTGERRTRTRSCGSSAARYHFVRWSDLGRVCDLEDWAVARLRKVGKGVKPREMQI